MRRPWRIGGSARPWALPRIWGRSLSRSLLTAYVKTSRSCHTASRAENERSKGSRRTVLVLHFVFGCKVMCLGYGTFYVHRLVSVRLCKFRDGSCASFRVWGVQAGVLGRRHISCELSCFCKICASLGGRLTFPGAKDSTSTSEIRVVTIVH